MANRLSSNNKALLLILIPSSRLHSAIALLALTQAPALTHNQVGNIAAVGAMVAPKLGSLAKSSFAWFAKGFAAEEEEEAQPNGGPAGSGAPAAPAAAPAAPAAAPAAANGGPVSAIAAQQARMQRMAEAAAAARLNAG